MKRRFMKNQDKNRKQEPASEKKGAPFISKNSLEGLKKILVEPPLEKPKIDLVALARNLADRKEKLNGH